MTPAEALHKYWGYTSFRKNQEQIINHVLENNDTLALLPTGGGKSLCFQIPALCMEGLCLVISPLIALMKDQVEKLQSLGIAAHAIYSGMNYKEVNLILNNCIHDGVKFLYLSPERLGSFHVKEILASVNISLIAVDEAHCISQWGFDFRPSYRQISEIRNIHPKVPILALTASATTQVIDDIQEQLNFRKKAVFTNSFERKNLHYVVRYNENKFDKIIESLNKIRGSSLIYVRSRKRAEELASQLYEMNISTMAYHAGLTFEQRTERQNKWITNKIKVLVCTNAFGMGIDKPDCRLVIHEEMPDSLEAYYQEAGRAGRDGKKSYCLLLGHGDLEEEVNQRMAFQFPDETTIRQVYAALCSHYQVPVGSNPDRSFNFSISEFCEKYKLKSSAALNSIKILEQLELILLSENFFELSKLKFVGTHEELYKYRVENPKFDTLLMFLFRSYGGLFERYVVINERFISSKLKIEERQVVDLLLILTKHQMVDYLPQLNMPQITFLNSRIEADYINFSNTILRFRKQVYLEKLNAMRNYTQYNLRCRSRVLLQYFNETDTVNCGICDVCIQQKKQFANNNDLKVLEEKIIKLIQVEPKSLIEILNTFGSNQTEEVNYVLRNLLDKHKLYRDNNLCFNWINPTK